MNTDQFAELELLKDFLLQRRGDVLDEVLADVIELTDQPTQINNGI